MYLAIGPYHGGPVESLIQLVETIDKSKVRPYILCLPKTNSETRKRLAEIEDVVFLDLDIWINNWLRPINDTNRYTLWHYIKWPGRFLRLISNGWRIANLIKKNRIDIVYSNIELILEGALGGFFSRRPHVWHLRAPIGLNGVVKHFLGQKFCCFVISGLSEFVIVNSLVTRRSVEKYISNKKLRLVYNGITPENFKRYSTYPELRTFFNIPDSEIIIVSIGYLSKLKGGLEFMEIIVDVCKSYKNATFIWIGESFERKNDKFCQQVFERINKENLNQKVHFTGEQRNIGQLLTGADIFLQPMVNGSWSRVVMEAMASSLPVVAIDEELQSEIIINNETGILARNTSEAAEHIIHLIRDPLLRSKLGLNGRKRISRYFTNKKTSEDILAIYDEISCSK